MSWRDNLLPASFRGAGFHVEAGSRQGGRRPIGHEYPKKDVPTSEDMGRKALTFTITAYVIGPDYNIDRDELISAMETEGPGLLVHPTMGEFLVQPGVFTVSEDRQRGGMATFELPFIEAGDDDSFGGSAADTQGQTQNAATAAGGASAGSLDANLIGSSGDYSTFANNPIG